MGKAYTTMQNLFSVLLILTCASSTAWGQQNRPEGSTDKPKPDQADELLVEPFYLVADWSMLDDATAESYREHGNTINSCDDLLSSNFIP